MKLPKPGKNPKKAEKAGEAAATSVGGVSPNPMTNAVIADLALRTGGQLLRRTVETGVLGKVIGGSMARDVVKGRSMARTLIGTAIARIATRSVPGALIVGGGLLAKALYERRHARDAAKDGQKAIAEQAAEGKSKA